MAAIEPTFAQSREIVQSRDMTLAEAKTLTRAVTQKYMRNLRRDIWYHAALFIHSIGMVTLLISALQLAYLYRCCSPAVFWFVTVTALLFIGGTAVYYMRHFRGIANINRTASPAGSRHFIDAQGYTISLNEQRVFIPWHRIEEIDRKPDLFLTGTSAVHFWPIPFDAFANQDVAGFCAELEQRWNAARGGTA